MNKTSRGAAGMGLLLSVVLAIHTLPSQDKAQKQPTFYRDGLAIIQGHCQVCHRAGGNAPMPFETYEQTRPFAAAIRRAVERRTMPPWFADKGIGKFSNDPSLSEAEIAVLAGWAEAGAPAGEAHDAPAPRKWLERWTIPEPQMTVTFPEGVKIPADGEMDYTYVIVPTHFAEGRWVKASELLPGMPENVHHAV
ncbi:MAG TPA: cytochrome c, partial [Candidatus Acidoferrum sp.]|nr:cytochrome c [Candidatus Acidoferrum sp.]